MHSQTLMKQQGMSLGGLIMLLMLLMIFVYVLFRTLPAYMEYWTLEHVMDNSLVALGEEKLTATMIRARFKKELDLNNLTTVTPADLLIEPTKDGYRITAEYSVKKPLWREVSLYMDFKAMRESK
jgi:hypothetical protein